MTVLLKKFFKFQFFILNIYLIISSMPVVYTNEILAKDKKNKNYIAADNLDKLNKINWQYFEKNLNTKNIINWQPLKKNESTNTNLKVKVLKKQKNLYKINSLNRSIVFDNEIIGPDISWLVPPGLKWNKKYKFDGSVRGHNRRKSGEKFLSWNGGDAIGQFYYQPFHTDKTSFGLNLGARSVYQGPNAGGGTSIGEGLSSGFRLDHSLSTTSGVAFGAEQLLHFDGLTDTGRDIYLTISKGFWMNNYSELNSFPLVIATAGIGTGKMAEGNIKGLCSDLLGGSGTEVNHQRRLCWAPIFSIAKVYNEYLSTFFEYNSKFFLLGTSLAPFEEIPIRGTFALQISDHIENYKLNNFDNLKWVFRLSLGF